MSALGQSETPRVSRHGVSRRVSQAPKAPGPAPGLSQGQRQSGCILPPLLPSTPGKDRWPHIHILGWDFRPLGQINIPAGKPPVPLMT